MIKILKEIIINAGRNTGNRSAQEIHREIVMSGVNLIHRPWQCGNKNFYRNLSHDIFNTYIFQIDKNKFLRENGRAVKFDCITKPTPKNICGVLHDENILLVCTRQTLDDIK